jgi:hypothetical protein
VSHRLGRYPLRYVRRFLVRSYRPAGGLLLHLGFHQLLDEEHEALLEGVDLGVVPVLAQKLPKCDPHIGHRLGSSFQTEIAPKEPSGGLPVKGARRGHPHGYPQATGSTPRPGTLPPTQRPVPTEVFWQAVGLEKEI